MIEHTNHLHVIVTPREHDMLEGKLVELRITVGGKSEPELLAEFAHAIEAHYEHAKQSGLTPFANLFHDDPAFGFPAMYHEMGEVRLPKAVSEALAIAIRAPKPDGVHLKSVRIDGPRLDAA